MAHITLEINNTDLQLAKQLISQLRFVKKIYENELHEQAFIAGEDIDKMKNQLLERSLNKIWDIDDEDMTWNDYLKQKLSEDI
jgi:hypothetical protein